MRVVAAMAGCEARLPPSGVAYGDHGTSRPMVTGVGAWLVSLATMHTDDAARAELVAALSPIGGELVGTADAGRCTARLIVPGQSPADALGIAMEVWRSAVDAAGRPGWPVFAAEVVERVDAPTRTPKKKASARKSA